MSAARTYLYAPGDRPERFAKAAASGVDAVVLDLEDGVAPAGKEAARLEVGRHDRPDGPEWWVRVDARTLEKDVAAAVRPGTTGVVVPGAEPTLLARVDDLLPAAEDRAGLPPGSVQVIGLLETAHGLDEVAAVARAPRVVRLGLGEADLAANLGISPGAEREELWPARFAVVLASAAAGLAAPVGPVETRLGDDDVLRRSTERLVRQGFTGRTLIHPAQVAVVHMALAPSAEELASAREIVEVFDRADRAGLGAAVTSDGRLVDLAVVRSARRVLARAGLA
ncbi:HpcH/HpaI aldolase/citrate lyase family protein [Nocardioides deserti]|uniref:HpcH/HpaI aldolase/citrate lyase family protein n=1 Tax=Nocardioides deserti TaxID=1588644 RepID=UPI0019B3D57F|nr:CoA ester lyase [Nocardioides deserti]GGO73058.1 malyl-CoA lyase [Nocardioides deserti]